MNLSNKVAIVTGGAQGIGKAYSVSLLENGCFVCVCDINEKQGRNFVEEFSEQFKDKLLFIKCDVSLLKEFEDAFVKASEVFGHVDILINNAGLLDEKNWKRVIDVNFIGVIHGIQLAFEHMGVENGGQGGFIINTASNAGLVPFPLGPIYCGTKHGIVGLTKSYGSEFHFARTHVTVNAICPEATETELYHSFPEKCACEKSGKELLSCLNPINPAKLGCALIQLLQDGKNGALLAVDSDGVKYVPLSGFASAICNSETEFANTGTGTLN